MPTQPYFVNGKRVPGVTTVIGSTLGWAKDALMYWAWKLGMDGIDYRKVKERAADAGTIAHDMIECDLKGKTYVIPEGTPDELLVPATNAFKNYLTWKKTVNFKVIALEFAFTSEEDFYGGCIDCVAEINGQVCIFDWKTSNSLHEDYAIQLSGYEKGWNENNPDNPITGGVYLLRIDKETAGWDWIYREKLEIKTDRGVAVRIFAVFKALRFIYSCRTSLKRFL